MVVILVLVLLFQKVSSQKLESSKTEYDFIIVGGGTSGCVLANRLSEISNWSVLLLEAGGSDTHIADIPYFSEVLTSTELNWKYSTKSYENACLGYVDSKCAQPRGKGLGGSSVINYMVYTRGNKQDYNGWAAMGNYGWDWESVEPYFKKLERVKIPFIPKKPRGVEGPLYIEYTGYKTNISKLFLEAGVSMGYEINDPNGVSQIGFSYPQHTLKRGRRCSSAKAYLQPVMKRRNLYILTGAFVTKILIDSQGRTFGVEFTRHGKTYTVKAVKEVLMSAGVMITPKLMMLSGIGPEKYLNELGIPVIKDLPVGENLREHVGTFLFFVAHNEEAVRDPSLKDPRVYLDYFFRGKGYLASSRTKALAFLKLNDSEGEPDVPDIEIIISGSNFSSGNFNGFVASSGMTDDVVTKVFLPMKNKYVIIMPVFLMQPKSVGSVRLQSSNPRDPPIVDPRYFSAESDVDDLVVAIKKAISIAETEPMQRLQLELNPAKYPKCDHLEFKTDEYWRCAVRQITLPFEHHVGTCRMGPDDDLGAVVDPELRVRGVSGLRIVDSSIMPRVPRAHPQAAVYMVAEKTADLIKTTWIKDNEMN